ncbi:hypothetical protein Y032_0118g723 [Ancylostoma ceylanicum]|uniref:Uncharacterized protein n=1 Tax=Ancylostoma ceylanicum TaxID=53326 RepID=A0A016TAP6_9BILA|nr:hypothetical protein Y032_0118g723 [Ancylostoma ceylanicum]
MEMMLLQWPRVPSTLWLHVIQHKITPRAPHTICHETVSSPTGTLKSILYVLLEAVDFSAKPRYLGKIRRRRHPANYDTCSRPCGRRRFLQDDPVSRFLLGGTVRGAIEVGYIN